MVTILNDEEREALIDWYYKQINDLCLEMARNITYGTENISSDIATLQQYYNRVKELENATV